MRWHLVTILAIALLFIMLFQIKPCTMQAKAHAMSLPLASGIPDTKAVLPVCPAPPLPGAPAAPRLEDSVRACCDRTRVDALVNGVRRMVRAS
jgi:hypothetical protein